MSTDHQSQPLSSVASAGNFPPSWTPPHNEVGTVDTVAGLHYLPGLRLTPEQPPPGKCTVVVKAEQVRVTIYPKCGCVVKDVKANGTVKQLILDEPRGFRRVFIELRRQRFKCKSCGMTVFQPLECVVEIRCLTQPGRKTPKGRKTKRLLLTKRLHEYIQIESLLRPDLAVANSTGVSVKIVRAIRKKFTAILEKEVRFKTPRVLGIDGVRVDGTLCTIITDIEKGIVVDLLKGHNKKIIMKWIEGRPDKANIALVTMDMSITESSAIEEALPHSIIIIDKFHILKMANEMMDAVRLHFYPKRKKDREPGKKRYPRPEPFRMRRSKLEGRRKYLEVWFKIQPQLEIAYNLKEDFLEIWEEEFADVTSDTGRSAAARKLFEEWEKKIPQGDEYKALRKKCDKITGAVRDWGTYIFNYFNYPFTNAFTESANRWVKDDKRDLRGCSFETAKARLVLGTYLERERVKSVKQEEAQLRPNLHNPRKQNVDTAIKRFRRETLARLKEAGGLEPQGLVQTSFDFLN